MIISNGFSGVKFASKIAWKQVRLMLKYVLISVIALFSIPHIVNAQDEGYDVFVPISKYISKGDVESLSAWFSDNLEVTILSDTNSSSKSQAKQILNSFFKVYTPRSFKISHTASKYNMKYALGTLNAGGEVFLVTLFVRMKDSGFIIQQLKIEKID